MAKKEQFDKRFGIEPRHEADPGARKRSRFVCEQQMALQAELKQRPANIQYFEKLLAEPPVSEMPRVGVFCNMVPLEIIRAMGAVPVQLGCGNAARVQPGEEILSGEICPLAKASFATFLDNETIASKCKAVIIPTTCDAKKKLGEVLSDYVPTYMLNLPPEQDAGKYGKFMSEEIQRMVDFLSGILKTKLSRKNLLAQIQVGQKRTELIRELQQARASKPAALSVRDFYVVIQSSITVEDLAEWLKQVQVVLDEVAEYVPKRKRLRPRMILTGAPIIWPNFKVLNLIEEAGADVVADTICTGAQSVYDPVVMDEQSWGSLLRALSFRYVFASACPCFISQATRLSRVLELVDEFKADGVVGYGLRLCQLFDIEVYRVSRIMKERKIPFMNLRTDYSIEDTEQLRVRLEAFLETIGDVK